MNNKNSLSTWIMVIALVLLLLQDRDLNPNPDPGPEPTPQESPIKEPGLHVLIVEETSARSRLTPEQLGIFVDSKWRQYVDSKDGEYRVLDQHANFVDPDDPFAKAITRDRDTLPWLIVSNYPKGGEEIPLPSDPQALLDVIKKWGEL